MWRDIIPHDASQIILCAFFIWRSMMHLHYPLVWLDNFCIFGVDLWVWEGLLIIHNFHVLPFSTDHHAKLASVHLHYCTTQLFRATVEDAVKSFVSSYWKQPQMTKGREFWCGLPSANTGAVKHGTDSSSNRQRGAASGGMQAWFQRISTD